MFSKTIGHADLQSLKDYTLYQLSGAIHRTDVFKEIGGFDKEFGVLYYYEYMLRLLSKKQDIYVVPKIGYIHTERKDSWYGK